MIFFLLLQRCNNKRSCYWVDYQQHVSIRDYSPVSLWQRCRISLKVLHWLVQRLRITQQGNRLLSDQFAVSLSKLWCYSPQTTVTMHTCCTYWRISGSLGNSLCVGQRVVSVDDKHLHIIILSQDENGLCSSSLPPEVGHRLSGHIHTESQMISPEPNHPPVLCTSPPAITNTSNTCRWCHEHIGTIPVEIIKWKLF